MAVLPHAIDYDSAILDEICVLSRSPTRELAYGRTFQESSGTHATGYTNWLKQLDTRIGKLSAGSHWLVELRPQRCRRFIMTRFPKLPRLLTEQVFFRELSRGENLIRGSRHVKRVLDELDSVQIRQLGALILDVIEAIDFYRTRSCASQTAQKLAAECDRRSRMLASKASKLGDGLKSLKKYAQGLHPLLGLKYVRAADKCTEILSRLADPLALEVAHALRDQYPTIQDPRQLGIVQLYWFFQHECGCSGRESEVRVAMIANELLACNLAYISEYESDKSKGCPAVRQAVLRYRPQTTN